MEATLYPDPTGAEFITLYRNAVMSYAMNDIGAAVDSVNRLLGTSGIGLFTAAVAWGKGILSITKPYHVDDVIRMWSVGVDEVIDFTQSDAVLLTSFLSACAEGSFETLREIWNSIPSVNDLTGLVSALLDMYVTLRLGRAEFASRN